MQPKPYITPESWITMVQDRILTPYTKPEQVVIDKETADMFEQFETRARAHATAKGEHESMLYLNIFAIWNSSLWRAKFDTWEDYCDEWDKEPFGVSKSSIKHKMKDIKSLLAVGVTPDTIVKALGMIPMATRNLLEEAIGEDRKTGEAYVNRAFMERMPHGLSMNEYLEELADLGPVQANLAVDELRGKHLMFVPEIEYDEQTQRLLFKVVYRRPDADDLIIELYIPAVPDWAAKFIQKKLRGRG